GQCCFNETTGSAFYEMCLSGATSPPARAALLSLLSDEVDHARLGWAHLASLRLDADQHRAVETWLPLLARGNFKAWRARFDAPDRVGLRAHGCPSYAAGRVAVENAFRDLIRPGFVSAGFALDGALV